jgi:hypothetical protein
LDDDIVCFFGRSYKDDATVHMEHLVFDGLAGQPIRNK